MDVKYKTIYDSIKDKILNKEYPANSKIPDEISLCKEYNCSRMTMKKALDLLVQDRKSTRLNSSHRSQSRMPSSA